MKARSMMDTGVTQEAVAVAAVATAAVLTVCGSGCVSVAATA